MENYDAEIGFKSTKRTDARMSSKGTPAAAGGRWHLSSGFKARARTAATDSRRAASTRPPAVAAAASAAAAAGVASVSPGTSACACWRARTGGLRVSSVLRRRVVAWGRGEWAMQWRSDLKEEDGVDQGGEEGGGGEGGGCGGGGVRSVFGAE